MDLENTKIRQKVTYMPSHAMGDSSHPSCETGRVSSKNDTFIFVKFDRQVNEMGWAGTTAQACRPEDLAEG